MKTLMKFLLFASLIPVTIGLFSLWQVESPLEAMVPDADIDLVDPSFKDYNVIVVVLDALRADHLGCYGYGRDTTPFIDSLAEEGVLFERALSHSSYTCESIATLFSGLLPSSSPTGKGWYAVPDPKSSNLAELFSNAGYTTGFFTNSPVLYRHEFSSGFDESARLASKFGPKNALQLSEVASSFLQRRRGEKTMMYLHYIDPHAPYRPPEPFTTVFADEPFPNSLGIIEDVRPRCLELIEDGFGPGDPRFEDIVRRYDSCIASTDYALRKLFEGLEELALLENTFVIITSDHGEEFLEHDFVEHAWNLYDESIHVPLIFWAPQRLNRARIAPRVSLVDLFPTLVSMLEIPCEREDLAGESLFAFDGTAWSFREPRKPFIAELGTETRTSIRVVIEDNFKYFASSKWLTPRECMEHARIQRKLLDDFKAGKLPTPNTWGPVVYEALYDLNEDPKETQNRINELPDIHRALKKTLEEYKEYCRTRAPGHFDSKSGEPMVDEEVERLRTLGYF